MNLASVWKLPAIFVIEDNGYAESTASAWSLAGDPVKRAEGYGMPGTRVDGRDFFAVHAAAGEAIERARKGEGPSLLHVKLERFFGHFEGDAMTYRAADEVAELRAGRDCLATFRRRVTEAGLLDEAQLEAIDREAAELIEDAVSEAKAASFPKPAELLTDVYVSY